MKSEDAKRIHLENIAEFSSRAELSEKQRSISLCELTELFIESSSADSLRDIYKDFVSFLQGSRPYDRAFFLTKLFSYKKRDAELWKKEASKEEAVLPGSHGKIAVVKNKYNESAFSLLSRSVARPKAVHISSFSEACEAVYDNRCQFCILPTESFEGGKLFGFYSMLDRYELKIFAVCRIDTEEGTESVRYALVGRSSPDRLPRYAERTLECSVITDDGSFPSDIPEILNVFGAKLTRIDSVPVEYDELRQKYYLNFTLSEQFAFPLEMYLSTEYSHYTQIGLYPILK